MLHRAVDELKRDIVFYFNKYIWVLYVILIVIVLCIIIKVLFKYRRELYLLIFYKYTIKYYFECKVIQTRCIGDNIYHVVQDCKGDARFVITEPSKDLYVEGDIIKLCYYYNTLFKNTLFYFNKEYLKTIKGNYS